MIEQTRRCYFRMFLTVDLLNIIFYFFNHFHSVLLPNISALGNDDHRTRDRFS